MQTVSVSDRIRGSLFGGAVGDALGYSVEFCSEDSIFHTYGSGGIRQYVPDPHSGNALTSDDTQMTLFTLNALLFGMYRQRARGISSDPRNYAVYAYLGWLITQQAAYTPATKIPDDSPAGWTSFLLKDVPELYHPRAPGLTCL